MLYLNEPGSVRRSPSCNTGVTPPRHDEQEDAAVVAVWVVGAGLVASFIRPAAGIPSAVCVVISPRRWCLRAWVVPWASLATRDCACRRRLRPAGCFLLRVVRSAFEALCGAVCCGASGMSRAIPQAVFQGFEMGSLGLQRSWGCRGKFGHPNCMRLVGREARGSNSCVRSSAQGCCQPYLGVRQACARKACCVAGRGCGGSCG